MNVFELLFNNIGKNMAFSHLTETERIVKVLAVAIFYNEEVTEQELVESYKIIRKHFEELGVDDDEIELIKKELQTKLNEYQTDRVVFIEDKKQFLSGFSDDESKDYILDLLKRVFEADGLDDKEKEALDKLKELN